MEELGVKKTWHFMFKVGVYFTVILGMIVQLLSPALTLAAETPTQAVTGALTIKNQDEQGSPLNGAKYEIRNESHQVVATSSISQDGQATISNLPVGNYLPRKHSLSQVIQPLNRRKTLASQLLSKPRYCLRAVHLPRLPVTVSVQLRRQQRRQLRALMQAQQQRQTMMLNCPIFSLMLF